MSRLSVWRQLTDSIGVPVGTYTLHGDLVTVKTPNGSKTTQIGSMPPKVLARIMLRELGQEEHG